MSRRTRWHSLPGPLAGYYCILYPGWDTSGTIPTVNTKRGDSGKRVSLSHHWTSKHFHPTSRWKNMFHHLAASLNIASKWFPMFDHVQAFSSNILRFKQMFDHLAWPCHTKLAGKYNQSQAVLHVCRVIISAAIHTKCSVGSFIRCLIKHCFPV